MKDLIIFKYKGWKFSIFFVTTFFLCVLQINCVQTFDPATLAFEEILVVEATITDEFKKQIVNLSKTTPLENRELESVSGAVVTVIDDDANTYIFEEESTGTYLSIEPFKAEINRDYELLVVTADGSSYKSNAVSISGISRIDTISAVKSINTDGIEGIEIFVDGSGVGDNTSYFRYEYEETYEIKSLYAPSLDLVIASENPPRVFTQLKQKEERTCYSTRLSTNIILGTSQNLSTNSLENIPVRFIPSNDFILRERYSINVRQLVQSREVQSFYEALEKFSNLESLFSQTQPGFIEGNIKSLNTLEKKVLGIFAVASVASKRIFINFENFFPDKSRPAFINECEPIELPSANAGGSAGSQLIQLLRSGRYKYVAENPASGTFIIALDRCVDCTLLGTNVRPEFWED